MKRSVVLLDCDGVLANFLGSALPIINRISGQNYTPDSFQEWDLFNHIDRQYETACYDEFKKEGFCASFSPYDGAVEAIAAIQEIADVFCLTSPMAGRHWMAERTAWLNEHFKIPAKKVIHCSAKYLVTGDIFVDDRPQHVEDWSAAISGVGLLWDQPYNRIAGDIRRVNSWESLVNIVKRTNIPGIKWVKYDSSNDY